jgi:site-specific DNA recombinase
MDNQNIKLTQIDDKILSIFIPMQIRKKWGYVTIILPEDAEKSQEVKNPKNYNEKLVKAFANAYKWQKMLKQKTVSSLNEIAELEKTDKSYIAKIFKLNYVAPDIVEAILKGTQPANLNLRDFIQKTIPDLWSEQREIFGF